MLTFPPASLFIMLCHKVSRIYWLVSYRLSFPVRLRKQGLLPLSECDIHFQFCKEYNRDVALCKRFDDIADSREKVWTL